MIRRIRIWQLRARRVPRQLPLAALLIAPVAWWVAGPPRGRTSSIASSQPALHVIPFPNTPDASPESRIIFSALRPSDFSRAPSVTGSTSGSHRGRLIALPDHAGTAFAPTHPFTAGETVRVQAQLTSPRAGTASGDRGATRLAFSFTVAAPVSSSIAASNPVASSTTATRSARARAKPSGSQPRFRSQPRLDPPPMHVSTPPAPGSADLFLSPDSVPQLGPMILNRRGQLVWFHPLHGTAPFNLEVQRYRGRPVLTWWQGRVFENHGIDGQDVIFSSSYRPVAVLHGGWGYSSDLHEFQLTPQGTALIDDFVPVRANLTSVGGPVDGVVFDCVIQELDVRSGRVLWEWHALGHVPLTDSYAQVPTSGPYDYFHLNSIQQLSHHRLLISSPRTWALYLIDEPTGHVIWTLGGKHSSFTMGAGTGFEVQHDAHLQGNGLLTLFDDGQAPLEGQSSAKELKIAIRSRTVSLVRRYTHHPPLLTRYEGGAQLLDNRDMFVCWGAQPEVSEYTPSGHQIFNATFALGVTNYRAYRSAWTGHPLTRPAVALSRSAKGTTWLYVSWNGATRVARWRILGGPHAHHLAVLNTKRWSGFETSIALPSAPRYVAVQALDAHGHVLGRSPTVAARSG